VSRAAPGKDYFDTVLGGKKVLIMLDELAQYAARLSAAHPGGGEQLAAFLMGPAWLRPFERSHQRGTDPGQCGRRVRQTRLKSYPGSCRCPRQGGQQG